MAGADPLDRPKIDRLRRESQVRTLARQLLYREYPRRATPQLVDAPATGDGGQPRPGPLRHPPQRPHLQGPGAGALEGLLGQVEVAQGADQSRQHPRPLASDDLVDGTGEHRNTGWAQPMLATGRTSIDPSCAEGHFAAQSSADSRFGQSSR